VFCRRVSSTWHVLVFTPNYTHMMLNIFKHKDTPFFEATPLERAEAIERVLSQGTMKSGYFVLLLIATCMVVAGTLINDVAVVIGGMIIAPLLIPILAISLALSAFNWSVVFRSLQLLIVSSLVILMTSIVLTFILVDIIHTAPQLTLHVEPVIYIGIALCSGIIAAFAWVKENLNTVISGIAITTSLLPPLCQIGIGLTLQNMVYAKNATIVFGANVLGIIIAAVFVFVLLGFKKTAALQDKTAQRIEL
jgi:uncharacterized hydrophobic protein (TIGR00271 family)